MNWHELENGHLIAAAEAGGFDVLITADQNIRYQRNLTGRRIALIVLDTNHWDIVSAGIDKVREALRSVVPGACISIEFDRPPLRRRPFNPSVEC